MVQKDVSRGPETEIQVWMALLSEAEILLYKNIGDVTSNQASSSTVKNCVMLVLQATPFVERRGLVTLQASSCPKECNY